MDVVDADGLPALGSDVARETDDLADDFAAPRERPFVAVAIEEVRERLEALPLFAVAAGEALRVRADAGSLEFDVAGEQFVERSEERRVGKECRL